MWGGGASQSNSRLHWSPLITSKPAPLFFLLPSLNSSHTLSTTTPELNSPAAIAPSHNLPTPHPSTPSLDPQSLALTHNLPTPHLSTPSPDSQSLALTHSLPTPHPSTPSLDPSHSLSMLHPSTPSLDPSHSLPTLHPSTDPQSLAPTHNPT